MQLLDDHIPALLSRAEALEAGAAAAEATVTRLRRERADAEAACAAAAAATCAARDALAVQSHSFLLIVYIWECV